MDIGDILIQEGILKKDAVEKARQASAQAGKTLHAYLLDERLVAGEALARAYAHLFSIDFVGKITEPMADPALLSRVPLKFLRQYVVIPVLLDGRVTVVTANPREFQSIDELRLLLGEDAGVAVSTAATIIDAINRFYPLEGTKQMIEELEEEEKGSFETAVDFGDIEEKDILSMATEAPIIKLVNHIFVQAVKRGASDIHIEPFEKELRVRYRIDGIMHTVFSPPKRVQAALTSRIKIMANLNIAEKRVPQDGRIEIKVADKAFDIRVSVLPVAFGERIVMRLLDKTRSFTSLEKVGFSERDFAIVRQTIHKPNGIFFVTGPTGSGKTTTLYSVLYELNKPDVNIVTVEDPIEYQMAGVGQVQVREKTGMTFAAALRSILRQDPDIIMIGETRDKETAQIAIQSALTGHFVLSTLHTNDAPSAITRLIDMGVEPFLIASSVLAIMAQRLVRQLCSYCKAQYRPSREALEGIGLTEEKAKNLLFYEAVGCQECGNTGYKGRIAIFEVMPMTAEIAKLTVDRVDASIIRRKAMAEGMTLLIDDGIRKINEGLTTIEEVVRVAAAQDEE
jgi:general secretion pathway protein E